MKRLHEREEEQRMVAFLPEGRYSDCLTANVEQIASSLKQFPSEVLTSEALLRTPQTI